MDIEKYLPEFVKRIPTYMDFEGQKKAERTFQVIIIVFAAVGFVWGFICQQFSQTMYILIAGFVLSCMLTLPPWGIYRQSPVQWQKPRPQAEDIGNTSQQTASSASKSKKKK